MAFLFGGGQKANAQETPALDHITLQTSTYGQPVPIVYGTQRVPGNVIWYDEFKSERHEKKQEFSKGGSGETTSVEYSYSACIQMAICEGPINSFLRVWRDKDLKYTVAEMGFEAQSVGPRSNPTPWTHLTSVHTAKAVGYGGTAWIAAAKLDLPNASLRNHTVEVRGFAATKAHTYTDPRGTSQTHYDCHPMDILTDLLTNSDYGLGWDPARLVFNIGVDGTAGSSYENYCHALGIYLSLVLTEQITAIDIVQAMADASNSAPVWSQGKLYFYPYGDVAATGNSFTYTPDLAVAYDLMTDDLLAMSNMDPIQIERSNLHDTYNSHPVEWIDRTQDYKQTIAEDPDQADIEAFGLRRADPVTAHYITRMEIALMASRLRAQRSVWIRNKYKFKLPQRYILLTPMDLVTLTEPKLGLNKKVVRITEINENEEDGSFDIIAEEWPFGIGTHTLYGPQIGDGTATNYAANPGNAVAPIGFIPTLEMTEGALEFWMVTTGGPQWGGAEVHVSDDNITFGNAGTAFKARWGTLVNSISPTAVSIDVDLTVSSGVLASTTAAGASDDLTAVWIDGEVISYVTATLTGPFQYTLTGVLRGRRSTVAVAHSPGVFAVRLDEGVYKQPLAYARLGQTIYVKLVSFNNVGGAKQDISLLSAYTFPLPASPAILPTPTNVTIAIQTTEFP